MDVRNCKRCGKVYNYNGSAVCATCVKEEQDDFEKVRDYLFAHPNSTTLQVSQDTGIDVKVISRFLKEGRLLSDDMALSEDEELKCEKCGQSIKTGRFCEQCVQSMKNEFKQATKPVNPNNNNSPWSQGKVHTYEHIVKKRGAK